MAEARVPQPATLKRYGLNQAQWRLMLARQGGTCGVCGRVPDSGVLHTDHQHVRNWKRLPPAQRAGYVRGAICFRCNIALRQWITLDWLRAAVKYLAAYERRRARLDGKR